jgi:hypothetical protein
VEPFGFARNQRKQPTSRLRLFDYILTSQLIDQLGEYSVPSQAIGHGSRIGTAILTSPDPGGSVQDNAIQQLLQQEIDVGALPATNRNTLYFIFLSDDVQVLQGNSASRKSLYGYQDSFGTGGLAVFDAALTSTTSHELCSITDPLPGQGWYEDNHGEIGDICAWKTRTLFDRSNDCVDFPIWTSRSRDRTFFLPFTRRFNEMSHT